MRCVVVVPYWALKPFRNSANVINLPNRNSDLNSRETFKYRGEVGAIVACQYWKRLRDRCSYSGTFPSLIVWAYLFAVITLSNVPALYLVESNLIFDSSSFFSWFTSSSDKGIANDFIFSHSLNIFLISIQKHLFRTAIDYWYNFKTVLRLNVPFRFSFTHCAREKAHLSLSCFI